nr:hypothetical protein [Xenorhabdus sp. Flor]
MKYYRDSNNQVYAYSHQQIATGWVKSGLIPMTDAEVDRHLNPPITTEQYIEIAEAEKQHLMSRNNLHCSTTGCSRFENGNG